MTRSTRRPSSKRRISVVVISRNEGPSLGRTVEELEATLPPESEIVVVDDGSEDGSAECLARKRNGPKLHRTRDLGVARARNWGGRRTQGDIIIFADAHLRLEPDWWRPLVEALDNPKVGAAAPAIASTERPKIFGYGLTLPTPDLESEWLPRKSRAFSAVPVLPGCCLAMRRDTFDDVGGFDEGLVVRGGVDNETGVRLWLLGYEMWVARDSRVWHEFRKESPYPVTWRGVLHNRLRLALVHFGPERIRQVVMAMKKHESFGDALLLAIEKDVRARRLEIISRRVRDDSWFFRRFGLRWATD